MEYNLSSSSTNLTPIQELPRRHEFEFRALLAHYQHHPLLIELEALCELYYKDRLIGKESMEQQLKMHGLKVLFANNDEQYWTFLDEPKPHAQDKMTNENEDEEEFMEKILMKIENSVCLVTSPHGFYFC